MNAKRPGNAVSGQCSQLFWSPTSASSSARKNDVPVRIEMGEQPEQQQVGEDCRQAHDLEVNEPVEGERQVPAQELGDVEAAIASRELPEHGSDASQVPVLGGVGELQVVVGDEPDFEQRKQRLDRHQGQQQEQREGLPAGDRVDPLPNFRKRASRSLICWWIPVEHLRWTGS